jgi:hypothetical protein
MPVLSIFTSIFHFHSSHHVWEWVEQIRALCALKFTGYFAIMQLWQNSLVRRGKLYGV